jgi:hypothetical protein
LRVRNKIRQEYQDQQRNDFEHTKHSQGDNDNRNTHLRSEDDHKVLRKFRNKMDNIQYNCCPTCNEWIPAITIIQEECRRCHLEKPLPKLPKRFSAKKKIQERFQKSFRNLQILKRC